MTTQAPSLEVLVERDGEQIVVRAPAVGLWVDPPLQGTPVGPGSSVGGLIRLNRRYRLTLPAETAGTVAPGVTRERLLPLEYGQVLFHVESLTTRDGRAVGRRARAATSGQTSDLPSGTLAVVAPTDGIFYRRPSPDAAPFVEPGQTIANGQAVGLVEVMKTFNQILYGGAGMPDRVEVVEVRCGDVEEVRAGQVLMVVRAAE